MDWIFFVCVVRFGTIISTKAILDKNTNKCKGYGFVDFESPQAAESAVKALQLQGIQAQMAKVIVKVINTHFFALPFIASLKIVDDLSTDSGPYIPVAFLSFLTHLLFFFAATRARSDQFVPGQLTATHHRAGLARHALQVRHGHLDPRPTRRRQPKQRRRLRQVNTLFNEWTFEGVAFLAH